MLYLSKILGKKVYYQGRVLGKIADIAVLENQLLRPVSKIIIAKGRKKIILSPAVLNLAKKQFVVQEIKAPLLGSGYELYLKDHLLNKQVLDINGKRLVRVNDVLLENGGSPSLVGIEVGIAGWLRRLGLETLGSLFGLRQKIIPWQLVESISYRTGAVRIKLRADQMSGIYRSELADILHEVRTEEELTFFETSFRNIEDTVRKIFRKVPLTRKPQKLSRVLLDVGQADIPGAVLLFESSLEGLSFAEAQKRLEEYGKNEVAHEKPPAWWYQLIVAFLNPFTGILFVLGVTSFFTDVVFSAHHDWTKIVILLTMILVSSVLRFWQEFRSQAAAEKLKALVQNKCTVSRAANASVAPVKQEISLAELVPGDIVHLSAGDMIPADVRILSSKDLFISQAALTGESMPVEKYSQFRGTIGQIKNPLELVTLCFMGSNVISGSAVGLVVATGGRTLFGSIAKNILGKRAMTSFDRGVNHVSFVLIRFMLIMVPLVFFINGFSKGNWQEALFFALAIAVGLTPEMLPLVVTANLAKGAVNMAQKKVIVKRLNAIQNFGAMDILCTDKTGTLTEDRVVLVLHLDAKGEESHRVLSLAYLNSYYQEGLKNLLDRAVIQHKEQQYSFEEERAYHKVDEIPFDFLRRRMSVIVEKEKEGRILICKGAVEEILQICESVEQGESAPLNDERKKEVQGIVQTLNSEGLRVIAVAYKPVPSQQNYAVQDESKLTLVGYMGFLDPAKSSAKQALSVLAKHGIQVKILTGDNEVVTAKICKDVGLASGNIVLGSEIEDMSDETLFGLAEETAVFAKMNPIQKSRVIRALKSKGHTVGYMGDGINDAAAIREADVGISVDSAVDIAKESADIVLLEKDLGVLERGVVEGRMTFGNIMKYIKMTSSSNFGNVLSVLVASAFLPFLPMIPIQFLLQNLLYDLSQVSLPWDAMDKEFLEKPRKWTASAISRFMVLVGPTSSVFDIATFLVLWFVFKANSIENQSLFQSGWFVEGLLSQTLIVHMIRTQKIPFLHSRASLPVLLLTLTIMAAGITIPFTPLGRYVGLQALPLHYFGWLALILLGYCTLTQLVKMLYIRKFKVWL